MKKTVYFTSNTNNNNGYNWMQTESAIDSAVEKRDSFLKKNEGEIGKIDSEEISFFTMQNNQIVIAVIQLNYYLKK